MRLIDVVELVARKGAERHVQKRAGIALPLTVGAMLPSIAQRAVERARSTEKTLNAAETKVAAPTSPMGPFGAQARWVRPSNYTAPSSPNMGTMSAPSSLLASLATSALGNKMMGSAAGSMGSLAASPIEGVASGISGGISESIKRMMLGREFGERKDPLHMGGTAAIQTFGKGIGEMGVDLLRDMANKAMSAVGHAGDDAARQAILGDLKRNDPVLSSADDKVLMEAYHTMTRFAPVLSTDKNAVRSFLRQAVMSGAGPDYASIKLLADAERAVTGERT